VAAQLLTLNQHESPCWLNAVHLSTLRAHGFDKITERVFYLREDKSMSTTGRTTSRESGFGRSDQQTFTIPDSADGSAVAAIDLARNYSFIVVSCDDASDIPANTTLSAEVADDDSGALNPLYMQDGSAPWASGSLPTSGGFRFWLSHAYGAQRLRLILSNNTTGAVDLHVYGFDGAVR
jgi:hypothetical protein